MEFRDLPDGAQFAACEVLKNNFPSAACTEQAKEFALRIRDTFTTLYSTREALDEEKMSDAEKVLLVAAKTTKFINGELVKVELSESNIIDVAKSIMAAEQSSRHFGCYESLDEFNSR